MALLSTPQELGIPVADWRPGQLGLIYDIAAGFEFSQQFVVVEAPPGIGKSIVALGLARMMGWDVAMLTATKQLQDQYATTAPGIVDMRGRNNFACIAFPGLMADDGVCVVGEACEYMHADALNQIPCHYYRRKAEAREAAEVVTSYQYYLMDSGRRRGALGGRDLLVLDECHEIEDHVRSWFSVDITQRAMHVLGLDGIVPDSLVWLQALRKMAGDWVHANHGIIEHWGQASSTARRDYTAVTRLLENLATVAAGLEADPNSWVYDTGLGGTVTYKPVMVNEHARSTLLSSARRCLLMSATINPVDLLEIGLKPEDYAYICLDSPFPVENRPVVYDPVCKVNQSMSLEDKERWVRKLDSILEMHPDEKGLIHTSNYDLARFYLARSRFDTRLVSHTGASRAASLSHFKVSTAALVMVSPSMTTGVDLPYESCRFQIVGKLSWPHLGDPQTAKRMTMPGGQTWYANKTAARLAQSYGRGVRAVDDTCTMYVVDKTFEYLRNRYGRLIPKWFTEAIV